MENISIRKVDIINILSYMIKKWFVVILVGILFAGVIGGGQFYKYKVYKSNEDYANANYIAPVYGSFTIYVGNYDGSENYYNRIEDVIAIVRGYDSINKLCQKNNIAANYFTMYNCVAAVNVGMNQLEISVEGSLIGYDQEGVVKLAKDLSEIIMDTFDKQLGEGSVKIMDEPHAKAYMLEKSMTLDDKDVKVVTKKSVIKVAFISGVIGCVIGAVIVLFYYLLGTVLRTMQEVVECYDIPLLGVIDRKKDNKEEYKRIARRLTDKKIIAVVSATDCEFRQEQAYSLSESMAVNGKSSLLVNISNGLQESDNGLYQLCTGKSKIDSMIEDTDKKLVKKIDWTDATDSDIDLFTNDAFTDAIKALSTKFDYLFICCPSMNSSAAGLNVANLSDALVVIAGGGVVKEEDVIKIKSNMTQNESLYKGIVFVK